MFHGAGIGGDALTTLEAASDHYEALQATHSKNSDISAAVEKSAAQAQSNEPDEPLFHMLPGSVVSGGEE